MDLLSKRGVPVPRGGVASTSDEAYDIAKKLGMGTHRAHIV